MTQQLCDTRVRVDWEMATERLQFHEMGIDDRLLKVTGCYMLTIDLKQTSGNMIKHHPRIVQQR